MRAAVKYLAGLVFLGVVVQVALAALGAFHSASASGDGTLAKDKVGDWFGPHAGIGYLVVLLSLVLFLVALAARDAGLRKRTGILFGLFVLQVLLAWVGDGVWALGFLHGVNALAIFAYSFMLVAPLWRGSGAHEPAPAL